MRCDRLRAAALVPLFVAALTGCGGDDEPAAEPAAPATTPIPTLSPLPQPEDPPATGRLIADMRQSSIDVSLGRMQVWIDNDTNRDVTPTRIVYRDSRLPRPLIGDRLRTNPAQSERGYPLYLPARPRCDAPPGKGRGSLEVRYAGNVDRVRVQDPTDVVGRFLEVRCQELALAEVAGLSWSDDVADDGAGKGAVGTLTLFVRPTGVAGHELVIDRIAGSHLLNSAEGPDAWKPGLRIAGDDPPTRIDLPLKPSRCDGHAFLEGGNATAFRVSFTLDEKPGEILLRMSPKGMGNALGFARASCGLG
jgi:hypothetical protein